MPKEASLQVCLVEIFGVSSYQIISRNLKVKHSTASTGDAKRSSALRSAEYSVIGQPVTVPDWKIKVQNFFKSPYAFHQPELKTILL
jgi:hypothetical protein